MYAVTSIPVESRTRAIFRSAELGLRGVRVFTWVHTPRRCGDPFKAGTTEYLQTDWSWGSKATARVFTSGADGKFEVTGLAYGNYTLEETKAPTGYNLRADVDFTVALGSYVDASTATITNAPTLTLPSTVTYIGNYAFSYWSSATEVIINATTPPEISSNTFSSLNSACVFKVPSASLMLYKTATNWSAYASKMTGV